MSYRKFRIIVQDVELAGLKSPNAHRMFTLLVRDSHSVLDLVHHVHDNLKAEELAEAARGLWPELMLSDYIETE